MKLETFIAEFIVASGGLAGIAAAVWRFLKDRKSRVARKEAQRHKHDWIENSRRMMRVMEILASSRDDFKRKAIRARVIAVFNSVGIPSPTSPALFSTVHYEDPVAPEHRFDWEKQPSDAHLRSIYFRVLASPYVYLPLSEVPPLTLLDGLYRKHGTESSLISRIGFSDASVWYVTFHFDHQDPPRTEDLETLRTACTDLRQAMGLALASDEEEN